MELITYHPYKFLTISNEGYLYKLIITNKRDKQQKIFEHFIEILN